VELALFGFAILLLIVFIGVPLGPAMVLVGTIGFAVVRGFVPAVEMAGESILDLSTNYSFTILPLFLMMASFITAANMSRDIFDVSNAWLGHRRGGLAMASVGACGAFSAISGSSVATAAAMSEVAIPEMRRRGYSDTLSIGCVAAGGTIGILIPPSTALMIYGILTEEDIGKLFMAGIVPGILSVISYILIIDIWVRFKPNIGPPGDYTPYPERFRALGKVWGVLLLFLVVLGGIYLGVFTPTEAGGIGAAGALLFAIARRRLNWRKFINALASAGRTTAMIFFLAFGAVIFGHFVEITGLTTDFADFIEHAQLSPYGVLFAVLAVYLLLGCVFEGIGMIMLTVPIFAPVIASQGFDMIWFGIIVVIATEISQVTPPVGMNAFVLKSFLPEVRFGTIYRGIAPFWAADILRLLLIALIPSIALFLPNLMG